MIPLFNRDARLNALARAVSTTFGAIPFAIIIGVGQATFALLDLAEGIIDDLREAFRGRD